MQVKLGPLVAAVAGSIGAVTFQRGKYGTQARNKPLPIRRGSGYAVSARNRLQAVNRTWATMSSTDRDDWQSFASTQTWRNRFGDIITGSGYMAFLKNNVQSFEGKADKYPFSIQTLFPSTTLGTLPNLPTVTITSGGSTLSLSSSDTNVDANTELMIFASPIVSAGMSKYYKPMPFLRPIKSGLAFPRDLKSAYLAAFRRLPNPDNNETCFIRILALDRTTFYPGLSAQVKAKP